MVNEDAYLGVALLPLNITRHHSNYIYPDGIRPVSRSHHTPPL